MIATFKKPIRLTAAIDLSPALAENPADRRVFPRKESRARVEGRRLDHSITARQQPRLGLTLRDLSVGGLSAISPAPLGVGERLAVVFPPKGERAVPGGPGGWDARGRVLRCEPAALGFRIAVEFDALPMAA